IQRLKTRHRSGSIPPGRRDCCEECRMIRKALIGASVGLVLLVSSTRAHAQAREHSWEVGYFAGTNFYANELKIENAFTYGLRAGYICKPAFEVEAPWAGSDESHLQSETSTLLPEHPPFGFVFSTDYTAKVTSYNLRVVGNVITDWRRWKPLVFVGVGHHN